MKITGSWLLPTTPSIRKPCRRLASRLTLLADGTATPCAQDARAEMPIGRWTTSGLAELWSGAGLGDVRAAQTRGVVGALPLCSRCGEWSRP